MEAGLILGLHSTNERQRYFVMISLIALLKHNKTSAYFMGYILYEDTDSYFLYISASYCGHEWI